MARHRRRTAVVIVALSLAASVSAQFGGFEIASGEVLVIDGVELPTPD